MKYIVHFRVGVLFKKLDQHRKLEHEERAAAALRLEAYDVKNRPESSVSWIKAMKSRFFCGGVLCVQ